MWNICFADAKTVWKKHQFTFRKLKKPKPHDLTVLAYKLRNAWNISISENVQIMNFQTLELTKSEAVRFYVFWAYKNRIQSVVLYKCEIDILLKIQRAEKRTILLFASSKSRTPTTSLFVSSKIWKFMIWTFSQIHMFRAFLSISL